MPFTLLTGRFHAKGYSPDGDSIRFEPTTPALLRRMRAKLNARNHAQLRIEAIDALETHYQPEGGGGTYRQPTALAEAAQDALFAFLNMTGVAWDARRGTVLDAHPPTGAPGFILCRASDKYGRPIAFAFPGDPAPGMEDGADVQLDVPLMRRSWNWLALRQGHAYPTYYDALFSDLRAEASAAVAAARQERLGIWQQDATGSGFDARDIADITTGAVILPKLFRRLVTFMVRNGTAQGFKQALEETREPVLDLRTTNFTHFDTFIEQSADGTRIRLTRNPEELVFDPMPTRAADPFATTLALREERAILSA
jgi:endonuclease YncB( thermonuclease family)